MKRVALLFIMVATLLSSKIITIEGRYCGSGAQIKSVGVNGISDVNIEWHSSGERTFRLTFPGNKRKSYLIQLKTEEGVVSGECRMGEECILTPWKKMLTRYAGLFGSDDKKSVAVAAQKLRDILGIDGDPYISDIGECNDNFSLSAGDPDNPESLSAKLLADIADGYLDDESLRDLFSKAAKRKLVSRPVSLSASVQNLAEKWGAKLMHLGTGQTFQNGKGISSGAPSEMVLFSNDGAGGTNILYHTFDRGQLSGRIDAYTQVAYDLFTSHPTLLMLPPKIQGELVDYLIDQETFQRAAELYEQLLEGTSIDSALYRRLLVDLAQQAYNLLKDEQSEIAANLLAARLLEASSQPVLKGCKRNTNAKRTVIDMTKGSCRHTFFSLFDGMLLDAVAVDNKPDENVVSLDFRTTSSLWYAVSDTSHYSQRGFVNDLLDPNLVEPLNGGMIAKKISEKKTSMPIANFDEGLKRSGYANNYVIYRNKTGALWDAPFILNALSLVDVIADLSSNIKFAKRTSKALRTMNLSVEKIKKKFKKNPWLKYVLFSLKASYEFSDALAAIKGVDILSIDQRYGQIRTLVDKLSSILKPDPVDENLIAKIGDIRNVKAYYNRFLQTAINKILRKKRRGEPDSAKLVSNSRYWKGVVFYAGWQSVYSALMSSLPKVIKEDLKIKNPKKFFHIVAALKARKAVDPNFKLTKDQSRKINMADDLVKNYITAVQLELIARFSDPEIVFDTTKKIKETLMSMLNLSRSFDTATLPNVIYNLVDRSLDSLKAELKRTLLSELTANVVMAVTPASWYRVLRGANQGGAMLYDMFSKPTAYAFRVKRLNTNRMMFQEIVPPAFAPIAYIDTKEHGTTQLIDYDSPFAAVHYNQDIKKNQLQMALGTQSAASLLAFPGIAFSYENDALVQEENLAQSYFEKNEDNDVVFADWHVYQHKNYKELKVPSRTKKSAFNGNYFFFKSVGENFDCIDDWSCIDEDERYSKGDGNPLLDDYLEKKGIDAISFFGFTRLFEDAGHRGDVTHSTTGVYTDSVHLWIGNRNNQKAPIQYASKLRVYIAKDYRQHQLYKVVKNSQKLTAVYSTKGEGVCGDDDYSVDWKLQDLILGMTLPHPLGVHSYRLYLRDKKNGRYFGPLEISLKRGQTRVRLSLAQIPGLIDFINRKTPSRGDELSDFKVILVDDIVSSYCEHIGKADSKLKSLMDHYWGRKGTKRNPLLVFWPPFGGKVKIVADSDGDGIPDDWEEAHRLDANDCTDGMLDSDNDNLSNVEEYLHGTDINNSDTDGDGMKDGWEVRYHLDPTDPADADEDSDHDGYTNREEYEAGTNPLNRKDHPTNKSPVADAGEDINITSGDSITLDGSNSYDPDGEIVSYRWTDTGNGKIVGEQATVTLENLSDGLHTYVLTVRDNDGAESNDTVNVRVIGGPKTWIKEIGGVNNDKARSVTTDNDGNIYVAGYIRDSDFNGYHKMGSYDGFVAKFNKSGTLLWGRLIGGSNQDFINDIAWFAGKLYLVGNSNSKIFDGKEGSNSETYHDAYVAVLSDKDGSTEKLTFLHGERADSGISIAVDKENVVIIGFTYSINISGYDNSNVNAYIASFNLDENLSLAWLRFFGTQSSGNVQIGDVVLDNDRIYFSGAFQSHFVIGGIDASYDAKEQTDIDTFIVSMDRTGSRAVVGSYAITPVAEYSSGLALHDGKLVLTGYAIDRGAGESAQTNNFFVTSIDPATMESQWIHWYGSNVGHYSEDLALSENGTIVVCGNARGDLNGEEYHGKSCCEDEGDIFIMRLTGSGTLLDTRLIGSEGSETCQGVTVSREGAIVFSGYGDSDIEMENIARNHGYYDAILGHIDDNPQ